MALEQYKIKNSDIATKGVVAAPDKLTGTAAENKAVFDRLIREAFKGLYNNLIDALTAAGVESAALLPDAAGFKYIRLNSNVQLEVSQDGTTWRAAGAYGPSIITASTATDLNGVLAGNGSTVTTKTVDSSPDASHTGNLITSAAVAAALAAKADWTELEAQIETSNVAAHAYSYGDYLIYNGRFYRVISDIAVGDTISSGTNVRGTTVAGELWRVRALSLAGTGTHTVQLTRAHNYLMIANRVSQPAAGLYFVEVYDVTARPVHIVPIFETANFSNFVTFTDNTSNGLLTAVVANAPIRIQLIDFYGTSM